MVLGTTRSPKLPSKPLIHPSCPAARSVVDLQVHHRKERPREFSRLVHPHSLLVHIASSLYCLSRTSEAETTQINYSFPRKRFASSLPGFHRVRRTHWSCISPLSLSLCFEHLCSTELSSKKKKRCDFLFLFMNFCITFQETGMGILDPAHKFECGITFASKVHFWPSSHVPLEFLINSGFMV
jgi:hypothetical protein